MIDKNMTVGEAVKVNPQIIDKLSDVGIDFCCGGNKVLSEAIEEVGFDVDSFINILNAQQKVEQGEIEDAMNLSKEELIKYIIETHHVKELDMLEEIDALLKKILNVHYLSHGEELAEIYQQFSLIKSDLIPHFAKEERVDFPEFLSGKDVDFTTLIAEHEKVGSLLDRLESNTNGFNAPEDGCTTYRRTFEKLKEFTEDIHKHIFLENNVLFKR